MVDYETLIYGDDGISPIKNRIETALRDAKQDNMRLRIDIRAQAAGTPNSRQEGTFTVDPEVATAEGIMKALVERCGDSPGPDFTGEIRINFVQAGSSGNRYGTFTRTVHANPVPYGGGGGGGGGGRGFASRRPAYVPEDDGGDGGGGDEMDNGAGELDGAPERSTRHYSPAMPMGMNLGITPQQIAEINALALVDPGVVRQWLETMMSFNFRMMSQNTAMFERAVRMVETFTMRYGTPHPTERGITEHPPSTPSGPQGLGLLPMLVNAAAALAKSDSPAEVIQKAGSMAAGQEPDPGAARRAAIEGVGRMIGQRRPPAPPPRRIAPPRRPPGGGGGSGSGGATFDDEMGDEETGYEPEGDEGGDEGMDEGGDEGMDEGGDEGAPEPMPNSGPPDVRGLSAEEMKQAVIDWIRADPARKGEVMGMLPDLTREIS